MRKGIQNSEPKQSIFQSDEMELLHVKNRWTKQDLLEQDGIFYLKDVARKLNLNTAELKRQAKQLESKGKSPWKIMGARKGWSHWLVRMRIFRQYYLNNCFLQVKHVEKAWDGNTMLSQKGHFYLREVCEKLPFHANHIRYQARKNPHFWRNQGVWKEKNRRGYLVNMETFATWVKRTWLPSSCV